MEKKIFIKTFGCQMNQYDSNRIYDSVKKIGFEKTSDQSKADCFILNTCHIRDKAKEKVYHEIGRIKKIYKKRLKPIMIVAGCVAQAENQEMLSREPYIDVVIGPQSYHKINDLIKKFVSSNRKEETEFDTISKFEYFDKIENRSNKVSSYLTIQEGCDKFCSFCVVPYTRGPEYSRSIESLVKEANSLTDNGAKEIVLLGQNVNAYNTSHNGNKVNIANLIEEISKNDNVKRIRYTTSHPINMSEDLINLHATNYKLMPFIHLPVQSGSSRILQRMNRKYDIDFYKKIIEKIKTANPKIEISSDFIIGYPGETDDDFRKTIDLVDEMKFTQSFSFIYSARPGTKSALEQDKIPLSVKKERLTILQSKLMDLQFKFNESFCGKEINVLIENQSTSNPEYFFGRTPFMQSVYVKSKKLKAGELKNVNISTCNHKNLYATC